MNQDRDVDRRASALIAALHLWDDVVSGRAAEPMDSLHWSAASLIGGQLVDENGMLLPASQLCDRLCTWLRPRTGSGRTATALDLDTFLVSWALSGRSDAVERWTEQDSPPRMDPSAYAARAAGWDRDDPREITTSRYRYLSLEEMRPDNVAGELVDVAVAELLNAGAGRWEPKRSALTMEWRQRMTAGIADRLGLFDSHAGDPLVTPTAKVIRLAFTMAVGAVLRDYVDRYADPMSEADETLRTVAEAVLPYWTDPQDLRDLRKLSIDYDILGEAASGGTNEQVVLELDDFRAIFRTFAERARSFREALPATLAQPSNGEIIALRRVSVLLELAIMDVLTYRRDDAVRLDDLIADVILEVLDTRQRQHESAQMLETLRRLHQRSTSRVRTAVTRDSTIGFVTEILERLRDQPKLPPLHPARAETPADGSEVARLVDFATRYIEDGRYGPDLVLREFADKLAPVVTALTAGDTSSVETPAEARWRLLEASGRALARLPETEASIIVAGSFAELGWVAANERAPADMRSVNDQVLHRLRKVKADSLQADVAGPLTRIMRVRPLADSKKANFYVAQRAAHESVMYGTQALVDALNARQPTVRHIIAVLTGLQLSLLQAGGVFVRSAETELILRIPYSGRERRQDHAHYISDLTTSAYVYTNLAVARLHDLRAAVKAGIVREKETNYPATAPASTAMMGMRTLLLWATMRLAYPSAHRGDAPDDVRVLIPSVPGQFRDMLALPHLSPFNFADMTRIALHYAFLAGSLRHPANGATTIHPATPDHLKPSRSGRLDLDACGAYLRTQQFDAGIFDVLELDRVRQLLDETSNGLYQEWRDHYHNPVKRSPTRFTRGELEYASIAIRDATVGR